MGDPEADVADLERFRPELHRYCYRMLASVFDADDAVQDTIIRAWRGWDQLAEPSARRAWVHRIATHVCLDRLRSSGRRALPMDMSDPTSPAMVPSETAPMEGWVWPADMAGDPAAQAERRETVRLAFIAALQVLPPRQRAVLILRDVYSWPARETADAMGMTVAAANSALQRARATLDASRLRSEALRAGDATVDRELLDRYVAAFERQNIPALVALFHEDGSLSMPPFPMWVSGHRDLAEFQRATAHHCAGSRLVPLDLNGAPAFAQYVPAGERLQPWGIHALELRGGRIAHVHTFIDAALFGRFGLPARL